MWLVPSGTRAESSSLAAFSEQNPGSPHLSWGWRPAHLAVTRTSSKLSKPALGGRGGSLLSSARTSRGGEWTGVGSLGTPVSSVMTGAQLPPTRAGWRAEMGPLGWSHGPGLQFLQQGLMRNWGSPSLPSWAGGSHIIFLAFPAVRGASVTWPWGWVMSGGCGSKAMDCCFSSI